MFYYTVNATGDGSELNPFRPDLPEGMAFVGQEKGGEYLVAVKEELPGREALMETLESVAEEKDITYDDVTTWYVGD